jgi:hypothetical protein
MGTTETIVCGSFWGSHAVLIDILLHCKRLADLTTDIVSEALFSGRPMSQQTPEAAPLSDYINRVSSGNWDEQPVAAS